MSPIRHLIEGLLKGDLVQIPAAQQPNSNQHLMPYLDHLDTYYPMHLLTQGDSEECGKSGKLGDVHHGSSR